MFQQQIWWHMPEIAETLMSSSITEYIPDNYSGSFWAT